MRYLHSSEIIDGHQMMIMSNQLNNEDNGIAIFKIVDVERPNEDELLFRLSWKQVLEACLQWKLENEKGVSNEAK